MATFKDWFANEAAKTFTKFGSPIPFDKEAEKDTAGIKPLARPGFRDSDRELIRRDSPDVEAKLTRATEPYGIHWLIGYLEPPEWMQEDKPEHWEQYNTMARGASRKMLQQFSQDPNMGMQINPQNTIVYIKPSSRAHSLSPHEQVHNIGHALWLRNPEMMVKAKAELQKAVHILQQAAYDPTGASQMPTDAEITVMLARLIDLMSYQRTLMMAPGDLSNSVKTAMTAFNSFDELIFDLIPAFVNAGGQLNLYPRGPGKIANFDRTAAITPNPEVVQQKGVRDWVWAKMASDKQAWGAVSKIMTDLIVQVLRNSTWAAQRGPIYPYKKLTTRSMKKA